MYRKTQNDTLDGVWMGLFVPRPWTTAAHCRAYWPPAGSVLSLTSSANGHYVPSSVPLLSKLQTVLDGGIALTTEKTETPLSHRPSVPIHTRAASHTFPIMNTDIRKTPVLWNLKKRTKLLRLICVSCSQSDSVSFFCMFVKFIFQELFSTF